MATGGADQTARIWDAATGQELRKLEGHTGAVRTVVFSPNGDRLLTGSDDYTLKIWDPNTGHETLTLNGHKREVTQAFFSPDGRRVFSTSLDRTIQIWDAGPVRDREILRAAAAACRLASFRIEGEPRIGSPLRIFGELTNVSGKSWGLPPTRPVKTPHRTFLRLSAIPLRKGEPAMERKIVLYRTDLDETSVDVNFRRSESFEFMLQNLKAGPYRLRLEYGWRGDDLVAIDEKTMDVTIAAK